LVESIEFAGKPIGERTCQPTNRSKQPHARNLAVQRFASGVHSGNSAKTSRFLRPWAGGRQEAGVILHWHEAPVYVGSRRRNIGGPTLQSLTDDKGCATVSSDLRSAATPQIISI